MSAANCGFSTEVCHCGFTATSHTRDHADLVRNRVAKVMKIVRIDRLSQGMKSSLCRRG
jgi:hypothetical protein